MEDAHASILLYGDVHERPGDAGTTFSPLGNLCGSRQQKLHKGAEPTYFPVVEIRKVARLFSIVEREKSRPSSLL
jgi:hypothetical protein